MTTLRESLATIGIENEHLDGLCSATICPADLDHEIKHIRPVFHTDGTLFVHCGGTALFRFDWVAPRPPAYLVVDDSDERAWCVQRDRDFAGNATTAVAKLGPCPRKIVRLAQSG